MLLYTVEMYKKYNWQGPLFAIFADLGNIEWQGTLEHCYKMCRESGIQLVVVQRSRDGMIGRWRERMVALQEEGKEVPHWSSPTNRYCTSHMKEQQIDKKLRQVESGVIKPFWSSPVNRYCTAEMKNAQIDKSLRHFDLIVCAVGVRAEESTSRAQNPIYEVRNNITTVNLKMESRKDSHARDREAWADHAFEEWLKLSIGKKGVRPRLALTWNAIHEWTIEEVWAQIGTSSLELKQRNQLYKTGQFREAIEGWKAHWAYAARNSRLSCSLCIMANTSDRINGAQHNPWTWAELVEMENYSGWSFMSGHSLGELAPHVAAMSDEYRQALYRFLEEQQLIYLHEHWMLNGDELTALLHYDLSPQQLRPIFEQMKKFKLSLPELQTFDPYEFMEANLCKMLQSKNSR